MKTTLKLTTTLVLFSTLLGSTLAFAAGESDQATTKGKVSFKAGGTDPEGKPEVNPPSHPDEPGQIIDPEGEPGGETGIGGPLSLDFAPNLDFDIHDISTQDKEYFAKLQRAKLVPEGEEQAPENAEVKDVPNFAQVTDKRGTGEGWSLSVTQKGQLKTEDGKVLKGAKITFANPTIMSEVEDEAQTPEVSYDGSALLADEEIEAATPLMTASEQKGMGQYQIKFGTLLDETKSAVESVKLSVPGKTVKYAADYSTELEWNLASGPSNTEQ